MIAAGVNRCRNVVGNRRILEKQEIGTSFPIKNDFKHLVNRFNRLALVLTVRSLGRKIRIMKNIGLKCQNSTFAVRSMIVFTVILLFSGSLQAQDIVDKTVAVVRDSSRYELITYSDLFWQLALQPGVPLDPPRSEDLNQALQLLINQRLFALEAKRIPRVEPAEAEITQKINDTLSYFPSPAVFEARLKTVGFDSIKDPAFQRIIAERLAIEKYVDFRFGSFVVVTADEEAKYYNDVFVPNFRRNSPGRLMPSLDEERKNINDILTRQKIAAGIERFLDETKRRTEIEILIEV